MEKFEKYLTTALYICEDYSTKPAESENVELIWFTPDQLKWYTEYCLGRRQVRKRKKTTNQ